MQTFRSPYPGYDVLEKWDSPSWNDQTRRVVAERLSNVPDRRFLNEREWACLVALCDCAVPQPERADPVPIAPWIDEALYENRQSGTRYAGLPTHREVWRLGLAAVDAEADAAHRRSFADLSDPLRNGLLRAIEQGDAVTSAWRSLPPRTFVREFLLKEVVAIYYAHPAAWNEIGFGGPASPRGYVRLASDRRDPWEAAEVAPDKHGR